MVRNTHCVQSFGNEYTFMLFVWKHTAVSRVYNNLNTFCCFLFRWHLSLRLWPFVLTFDTKHAKQSKCIQSLAISINIACAEVMRYYSVVRWLVVVVFDLIVGFSFVHFQTSQTLSCNFHNHVFLDPRKSISQHMNTNNKKKKKKKETHKNNSLTFSHGQHDILQKVTTKSVVIAAIFVYLALWCILNAQLQSIFSWETVFVAKLRIKRWRRRNETIII